MISVDWTDSSAKSSPQCLLSFASATSGEGWSINYWPLNSELKYMSSIRDCPTLIRMTKIGCGIVHKFVGGTEKVGLAPWGAQKTAASLVVVAGCLVAGDKEKILTPMYLMVDTKPLNKE